MPNTLLHTLIKIAALLALGGLIGWLYDATVAGLLVASLLLLAWQLFDLQRFYRWLNGDDLDLLPDGSGIWPQIFARVAYLRSRSKRRSNRLRQLLKELRASAKMFPDGGIILNANNEILLHNQTARALLGLKKKRDRGQRIENLIRNPAFVDYLNSGDFTRPVEISSPIQHDGWLSCHLVPYGPNQRLLLVRDVTQQRKSDDMRRDFVANASHELRTPLTVINGYLEAISDADDLPDDLRVPVREMQRQSDRMQKLVDDLLLLSELESTESVGSPTAIDLKPILEASRQEALAIADCPEDVQVKIESSARLLASTDDLESVVSNLVANAVRHTPPEGTITLEWKADSKGGVLSVTDTGVGIPGDHLPRITERFYRVDAGRGGDGGTGLGLAIVKHALARYGASLEIESEYGQGSRFSCWFPADRILPA